MSLDFEKYGAKGNEFIHLVAEELKVPRDMAGRIIRAVLHALRNRLRNIDDFLDEVRKEDGGNAGYDFGNNIKAKFTVSAVFKALSYFVSGGEINDVINVLPDEMKKFIRHSLASNETVF